mmetsp:Transcript_42836/g.128594  ORF Transcript_42836/g.128594 Transcript_42836/m.128594 type:complete len:212 (-) Transcript_42836:1412-2047(-)
MPLHVPSIHRRHLHGAACCSAHVADQHRRRAHWRGVNGAHAPRAAEQRHAVVRTDAMRHAHVLGNAGAAATMALQPGQHWRECWCGPWRKWRPAGWRVAMPCAPLAWPHQQVVVPRPQRHALQLIPRAARCAGALTCRRTIRIHQGSAINTASHRLTTILVILATPVVVAVTVWWSRIATATAAKRGCTRARSGISRRARRLSQQRMPMPP